MEPNLEKVESGGTGNKTPSTSEESEKPDVDLDNIPITNNVEESSTICNENAEVPSKNYSETMVEVNLSFQSFLPDDIMRIKSNKYEIDPTYFLKKSEISMESILKIGSNLNRFKEPVANQSPNIESNVFSDVIDPNSEENIKIKELLKHKSTLKLPNRRLSPIIEPQTALTQEADKKKDISLGSLPKETGKKVKRKQKSVDTEKTKSIPEQIVVKTDDCNINDSGVLQEEIVLNSEVFSKTEQLENVSKSVQDDQNHRPIEKVVDDETVTEGSSIQVENLQVVSVLNDAQVMSNSETYQCVSSEVLDIKEPQKLLKNAEDNDCENENQDVGISTPKGHRIYGQKRHNRPFRNSNRDVGISSGVGVSNTRGGSLQNLHSMITDIPRGRGRKFGKYAQGENQTLVSARQREGGSLPSNVNVQGRDVDVEMELLQLPSCSYTASANLDIATSQEDPASIVDASIKFPITKQVLPVNVEHNPVQLGSSYNSVKSLVGCPTTSDLKGMPTSEQTGLLYPIPVQHVSVLSMAIPPSNLTQDKACTENKVIKPVDENGNAIGSSNATTRRSNRKINKHKVNSKTLLGKEIEGHVNFEDIDETLKFIESTSETNEPKKLSKSDSRGSYKIRAKARTKDTARRLQKCNSLEEVSKSKLEDLTESIPGETPRIKKPPTKQATLDDAHIGGSYNVTAWEVMPEHLTKNDDPVENLQDAGFHVVMKKQRKRKRRSGYIVRSGSSNGGYYGERVFFKNNSTISSEICNVETHPHPRRKSASSVPPSEKSDSSDLDSVHSLPVSSSAAINRVNPPVTTSGGSTPQASYADITKSITSPLPPNSILRTNINVKSKIGDEENSNISNYPDIKNKKDAMTDTQLDIIDLNLHENFPKLQKSDLSSSNIISSIKLLRREDSVPGKTIVVVSNTSAVTGKLEKVSVILPEQSNKEHETLDTLPCSSKRPPVILVDDPKMPTSTEELTFGFDINNELLLQSDDNINKTMDPSNSAMNSHSELVNFVHNSWLEVMADLKENKAVYYSEQ
uniref:Uncharacterized protein n=1 Tax=Clastoptera arizonana TaxID=38151 RepID=A0A1B6DUC7_9HEMI